MHLCALQFLSLFEFSLNTVKSLNIGEKQFTIILFCNYNSYPLPLYLGSLETSWNVFFNLYSILQILTQELSKVHRNTGQYTFLYTILAIIIIYTIFFNKKAYSPLLLACNLWSLKFPSRLVTVKIIWQLLCQIVVLTGYKLLYSL